MTAVRTRFLTPGKIALLHVIGLYCDGAVPPEATINVLSFITERLVPTFTSDKTAADKTITKQFDVTLQDLQTLLTIPTPDAGHKTLWESFSLVLCLHQNLDHLFDFFGQQGHLYLLFNVPGVVDAEAENSLVTRLEPTSLFGTFIRRAQLEFDRLTFNEADALWHDYVRFRAPAVNAAKRGKELLQKLDVDDLDAFIDGSDGRIMAALSLASEFSSDDRRPEQLSKDDMEKLLEFQVDKIQKLGVRLPNDIKQHLGQILTTKEDASGLSHYARFLDSWFEGDYPSAFENLHRYYDYALNGRDRSRYPFALLNMAILHADFGCYAEALAAIHETISIAREYKDMTCLNFSLSWLHHFRSIHESESSDGPQDYAPESESQGLAFLKAKAQETKMWSVLSSTLLSEARLYLAKGRAPRQALLRVVESTELSNHYSSAGAESSVLHLQSSIYGRLGVANLSAAYDNMIVQRYDMAADTEDSLRARCRMAYAHALAGAYAAADGILARLSTACQSSLKFHQLVTAYTKLVKLTRKLHHNDLRAAMPLIASVQSAQTIDPEFRMYATLLMHDHLVRSGDLPTAFERIDAQLGAAEHAEADVALRLRMLIAKARLFARAGRAQKGLTLALRAAAAAREAKIMPVLFDAVGALGTVLIAVGNSREAEELVESVVYTAAESEDLALLVGLQSTLADACWTSAADEATGAEERKILARRALAWLSRAMDGYVRLEDWLGQWEMADKTEMLCIELGDAARAKEMANKKAEMEKVLVAQR